MACGEFTEAELAEAIRAESLLNGKTIPHGALNSLAVALFEHEINEILHMPDERQEFETLDKNMRARLCRNAAWLLGRMMVSGFRPISIAVLKKVTGP